MDQRSYMRKRNIVQEVNTGIRAELEWGKEDHVFQKCIEIEQLEQKRNTCESKRVYSR